MASGSQLIAEQRRRVSSPPTLKDGIARRTSSTVLAASPPSATTSPPSKPRRRRAAPPPSSSPAAQPLAPRPKQPTRHPIFPPRPPAGVLTLSSNPHTPPLLSPLPTPTPPPLQPPLPVKEEKKARKMMLRYMPPLELVVLLKEGYPREEAPQVELRDETGWLRPEWVERLQKELREGKLAAGLAWEEELTRSQRGRARNASGSWST